VRQLVELHGGNVSAESEGSGKGAAFSVYLPLRFEPPVETDSDQNAESSDKFAPNDESSVSLKGTRILLVDDEADAQILLTTLIGQYGATVMTAGSAAEALEIFRHFKPDILVSDIGMPKEDGYSLINKIRMLDSEENQTPAIALTAYTREDDRRRALAAGFQEHLKKPVNTEELINAIKRFAKENQKKKI
jgi:CheY-like chemotaxis protein